MTTTTETLMTENSLPMVVPANAGAGPAQGQWTYVDYAALPDGERYEIVDGVLYMTPAPNIGHQLTVVSFVLHLAAHVRVKGLGQVLVAPCDVELAPAVVVQPDVVVVLQANLGIITPSRIIGSPDLVIEIASPSTAGYDRREKQDAYAQAGVREYWIVDPAAHTVEVLVLVGAAYRSKGVFEGKVSLPSQVIPDFPVQVEQFFV